MTQLNAPYKTRPIRFLEVANYNGWRIKVYGIRFQENGDETQPEPEIVTLAKEAMLKELPLPALTEDRYGIGFLVIHQGQDRNWLLLDWWFDREIIKQKLFSSPLDVPQQITPAEPDLLACTWELAVHCFERQAWIETVLNNPNGPDIEAYFGKRFNGDV
ncbi:MAG: isochorismatase [Chloroflexota bacterium]